MRMKCLVMFKARWRLPMENTGRDANGLSRLSVSSVKRAVDRLNGSPCFGAVDSARRKLSGRAARSRQMSALRLI